jgi:hypothetical protein
LWFVRQQERARRSGNLTSCYVVVTLWLTRHDGTCFCRRLWLPHARAFAVDQIQQRVSTVRNSIKLYLYNKNPQFVVPFHYSLIVILLYSSNAIQSHPSTTSPPQSHMHHCGTPLRHTIAGPTISPGGVKLWRGPQAPAKRCPGACASDRVLYLSTNYLSPRRLT